MQGNAKSLLHVFNPWHMQIPVYQRNYDWKREQCDKLFSDLTRIAKDTSKQHFFGSIVRQVNPADEVSQIIDGQQRVTTISLLLSAMVNASRHGDLRAEKLYIADKIKEDYLIDKYADDEVSKVRLKPINKDMEAFDAIVLDKDETMWIEGSNVTRNYRYLYEKVKSCGLTLEELFAAIKRLQVIDICLEDNDDAQLIFESLNSTGLALNESDKVRNYMLMNMQPTLQRRCYEDYWNAIELCTKGENTQKAGADPTTLFIRDYLTIKRRKICKTEDVYVEFKDYCENGPEQMDRPTRLADMLTHARVYGQLVRCESESKAIGRKLRELGILESHLHYPFLISFLLYAQENQMGEEEIVEVIDTIENYWARRIICGRQSNALNKIFCTLHSDIIKTINDAKEGGQERSYTDTLKHVIMAKSGSGSFPNEKEVRENIATRDVYGMVPQSKRFLMDRLENGNGKECHDIAKGIKEGDISIEHIMPQILTDEWKESLGDDWDDVHNRYLHTLANLTLTGYNPEYGNRPFAEKRDGFATKDGKTEAGFRHSIYHLSETLKNLDKWTEKEMEERQTWITDRFINIFPELKADTLTTDVEVVSLADGDETLTGRSVLGYNFLGYFMKCNSWRELMIDICEVLYKSYQELIEAECAKNGSFLRKDNDSISPAQIGDGCFVDTNNSTIQKIKFLQKLFDQCGIDNSELQITLKSIRE